MHDEPKFVPNPLVMTPVLGCGLTRAHDRDAGRNTVSPRPFFLCTSVSHLSLWYSFVSSLSLFGGFFQSIPLVSCTLPRTTDRDLYVLTSFHLAQENKLSFAVIFAW